MGLPRSRWRRRPRQLQRRVTVAALLLACALVSGMGAEAAASDIQENCDAPASSTAVNVAASTAVASPPTGASTAAAVAAVAIVPDTGQPPDPAAAASTAAAAAADFRPLHPAFEPTAEWREVLDGQPVPPGLDIRFDIEAGKKFAKLPDGAAAPPSGPVVNAPPAEDAEGAEDGDEGGAAAVAVEPSVVWGTDLDVEPEEPPLPEVVGNLTPTLKQMLLDLPEPEPELVAGLRNKLSDEQMEEIYRRVWARRQEEIRDAFKASRDDAKLIKRLLGVLVRGRADQREATLAAGLAVSTVDEQMQALLDLEYIVGDIDHAGDFFHLGGLAVVADALRYGRGDGDGGADQGVTTATGVEAGDNHGAERERTAYAVRARAAWVLGTAVKNQFKLQREAARSLVLPDVLDLVTSGLARGHTDAAARGVYCLGALLRHNPAAQEQFVRQFDGLDELLFAVSNVEGGDSASSLLAPAVADAAAADACPAPAELAVLRKVLALVVDLAENAAEDTRPTHPLAAAALRERAAQWLVLGVRALQCAPVRTPAGVETALANVDGLAALLADATMGPGAGAGARGGGGGNDTATATAAGGSKGGGGEGGGAEQNKEQAEQVAALLFAMAADVVQQQVDDLAAAAAHAEMVNGASDEYVEEVWGLARQLLHKLAPPAAAASE